MKNLVQTGLFDVIGLEARDRVGGRVFTDHGGNELGAAWIHGTSLKKEDGSIEQNPVLELARECIPDEDMYKTMRFFAVHSDGSPLDSNDSIWDSMWTVLNKIKTSRECLQNAYKSTDTSIYNYISNNWAYLFEHLRGHCEKAVVKSVFEWQSYYATLWEINSIGSMGVDKEYDGDQLLIKNGGYTRILNHYLDHYNLRDKIKLGKPVVQIERNENGKTYVLTNDNELIEADIVVVTVPLGVLKNGSIKFVPPLPQYKVDSINRLGFGVYDKVFVTFKEPFEAEAEPSNKGFWNPNADVISVVPKADDDYNQFLLSARLVSMTGQTFADLNSQEHRKYENRDPDHIGIEMANISDVVGVPKIVMLIYGKAAKEMEAIANDSEALTRFAHSKLTNAYPNRVIPEIVAVQATTWGSDPYAFGSFANIPVGSSGQDMVNLSDPVDNKILFAGEATFPLHYSTVHGALKSGRREFARIMKLFYPKRENEFENLLTNEHENSPKQECDNSLENKNEN